LAAFATVGAIALQGVRQADAQLGDTACVIGLGLVGQLVVQLLVASGVRVFGLDMVPDRCRLAEKMGATLCAAPDEEGLSAIEHAVSAISGCAGADRVLLVAGGSSNGPVEMAARLEGAQEQPFQEHIDLEPLVSGIFPITEAVDVYERLRTNALSGVAFLFEYAPAVAFSPQTPPMTNGGGASSTSARSSKAGARRARSHTGSLNLGFIGAGNYASTMLLPHLSRREDVRSGRGC
jgi:voltage-gated potassium channel Kch